MNGTIDVHTHTVTSGHAYSTLYGMVSSAAEKGVRVFGCSDHVLNMPRSCGASHLINFKMIPKDLYGLHLLIGDEPNIIGYRGYVDLSSFYLEKLDYAITSPHGPCYDPSTTARSAAACLGAIENPHINIISHPDDGRSPRDYNAIVAAAKERHALLEVNSSSLHPKSPRPGTKKDYKKVLGLCRQYQVPVIIDGDAHISSSIGDYRLAHAMLEELVFPRELVVNTSIEKLVPYVPVLGTYTSGK